MSGIIGCLASIQRPLLFERLVMVGSSPGVGASSLLATLPKTSRSLRCSCLRRTSNDDMADLLPPSGLQLHALLTGEEEEPPAAGDENVAVKPVKFVLNPYAVPYVSLSAQAASTDCSIAGKMLLETAQSADEKCQPKQITVETEVAEKTEHEEYEDDSDTSLVSDDEEQSGDDSRLTGGEYNYLSSLELTEEVDSPFERIDHDIALLSNMFPNESLENIFDAYISHGGDLGTTVDLMTA